MNQIVGLFEHHAVWNRTTYQRTTTSRIERYTPWEGPSEQQSSAPWAHRTKSCYPHTLNVGALNHVIQLTPPAKSVNQLHYVFILLQRHRSHGPEGQSYPDVDSYPAITSADPPIGKLIVPLEWNLSTGGI